MNVGPATVMRRTRARVVAGRLALWMAIATSGFAEEVPTGRVLERVQCAGDATQSYALYVPTRFDRAHRWPVLFCFDPGARGAAAVEHFSAAAEKFGWIVAGSNNSRNGPWEANVAAINAVYRDVERFFPIDPQRTYTAGLSGGARVACQIAVTGIAHGVIACSAGFMNSETPPKVAFPFFGTAGVTDFNYLELRRVDRELEDRRAAHRVVIHPGGHEWPAAEVTMEAVGWLELQAIRAGIRARDAAWIQQEFTARQAAVPLQPADEHLRALQSLAADFSGLVDVTELNRQVAALAASREVRDARKTARAAEAREDRQREDLMAAVQDGSRGAVEKAARDLRARETTGEPAERQMATRVLQAAFIGCSESARNLMRTEDYSEAAPLLEMMTLLRPERTTGWLDLARARARLGDRQRALAALKSAAAAGFKDGARLEQDPAFAKLRNDPAFVAVVDAMK